MEKNNPETEKEINVEEIMNEIRAEIKRKGYKEKDVRFADINISYADNTDLDSVEFSVDTYKKQLLLLNMQKSVNSSKTLYADSRAGKIEIFFKKAFRKCARFYVEPIVSGQNEYNETNAMLMSQLYAAVKRAKRLEKRVEELEKRIEKIEKKDESSKAALQD